MGQLIRKFVDGSILEYDRGKFDDKCVYLTRPNQERYAPRDIDYFDDLKLMGASFSVDKVYGDYVAIYEETGTELDNKVFDLIHDIASSYEINQLEYDIIFTILYAAMIAEEQKAYTKLGKRIKRLGIHMLLIENKPVNEAANFMRGLGWRDIDKMCKERGF